MLNVMPVPAQVATANAPVFAAPSVSTPNAQDTRTAATDVQHSLQLFQAQRRNKKRDDDDFIKRKIRNILAELADFSGAVGDEDDEPELLWYPPTAFEISQHFVQSRLEYLKVYSVTLRSALSRLARLEPMIKVNKAIADLGTGRQAELISAVVDNLTAALQALEANQNLLVDELTADTRERDRLWRKAQDLMQAEDSRSNQTEFNCLTGLPLGVIERDSVLAGSIGAYNEIIRVVAVMRQTYEKFRQAMSETVNSNFGTTVLSGGRVRRLPDSRGHGKQVDVEPIRFNAEQRRVRSLMRELGLLRRGFTIEQTLKGIQNMPQRIGSYSATDNLLAPKRKEDPLEVLM